MNKFTKAIALLMTTLFLLLAVGCGSSEKAADKAADKGGAKTSIKVGTTAGPHAQVMEKVKAEAEKQGLKVEIVEFNDYIQPNVALAQKDLDINVYQHKPFLERAMADRQYKFVATGKSIILPMGIYSKKVKAIADLKPKATIAIPNDPTNGGRALLLLEKAGVIKLKPGVGVHATVLDIAENPKNFKIIEIEAAQTPRSLDDVDLVAINTNYALPAGLVPAKDALLVEDGNSPYANLIVVRAEDKDNPTYQKFAKIYQSEPIKQFVLDHFKGTILPSW
ncbi:metal ABC transporter substrate-binding protein [Anaerosporomusa subterranea]|uniref:Lipoprotein n=1 Tax=Anaerosporomusa subterranea TaxID=1794912 RepID=A0A154BMT9_ANASB|nr:MetQ/NlpA family ABC transporter substrate-binding protein [Anaerosporomusa subterranea]KYZ74828.1 metal ABC transporter substrate-binding protein [Anaerosporomusa subterranea]